MATRKKTGPRKSCACPKGFDLSAKDPLTGKRYKRPRCSKVTVRGRKASVKTKAPKCIKLVGSCPTGYEIAGFDPKTGRRFKRATCVAKNIVSTKSRIAPKSRRKAPAKRRSSKR